MSKKRLFELIDTFCKKEDVLKFNKEVLDKFADYLFADGWIRLPCKVGDIVYEVVAHYSYIMPREVVGFHLGNFPALNGHERKPYLVCYDKTSRLLRHIPLDKLGKTVFLTREEAEKKLKEGEGK